MSRRGSVTPLRGGSSAANSSLGNWQWLSSSKSFHDMQLLQQVLPAAVANTAAAAAAVGANNSRQLYAQRRVITARYLDHLETLLPRYCKHLAHPTYKEAANAMSLLLSSPPPVTFMPGSHKSSQDSPDGPETRMFTKQKQEKAKKANDAPSSMKSLLSSPFRSRRPTQNKLQDEKGKQYHRWGSGTRRASTSSSSQSSDRNIRPVTYKLDEAAWQEFVSPLVLLAGAEAIYADLEHVHPAPAIIQWRGLYQRVASELLHMLPAEDTITSAGQSSTVSPATNEDEEESCVGMSYDMAPKSPPSPSPRFMARNNLSPTSKSATSPMFYPSAYSTDGTASSSTPPRKNTTSSTEADKVKTKYKSLRSLKNWLDIKCQWVPFHESLYLTWSSENLKFLRAFADTVPSQFASSKHASTTNYAASSQCCQNLMDALQQEIQTTVALMEMAFYLERGRFLETVVGAQKVKKQLLGMTTKDTALALWMKTTFQDYLSIMPLVFDRVHTFATPLYGFDQQVLLDATRNERTFLDDRKGVVDLDTLVVDLLRRQEKAGGTDMAVAIVLDSSSLSDDEDESDAKSQHSRGQTKIAAARRKQPHRVELGFAIHQEPKSQLTAAVDNSPGRSTLYNVSQHKSNSPAVERKDSSPSDVLESKQLPAIYLRSTTRLIRQARASSGIGGSTLGLISGMRRAGSTNRGGSTSALDGPSSGLQSGMQTSSSRPSWSSEKMSPRSKPSKANRSLLSHGNVFEYEAESSNARSWPHSEWNELKDLLGSMDDGSVAKNAVTDRPSVSPNAKPPGDPAGKVGTMNEEPSAVTFYPGGIDPGVEAESGGSKPVPQALFESGGSLFSAELPKHLWESSTNNHHAQTTFHAVRLSKFMWMIVMIRGEEESRWHRRKSRGLPDEEIRGFLNDMASKLRVSNRFLALKTCQTARVKVRDSLAPRVRGRDLGLRDAQWQSQSPEENEEVEDQVLSLMKEAFNVSANSPMLNRAESILTTMSTGFRGGKAGSRSPHDRRRILASQRNAGLYEASSDYREGASLFFLGPALYRQFLESTNEP